MLEQKFATAIDHGTEFHNFLSAQFWPTFFFSFFIKTTVLRPSEAQAWNIMNKLKNTCVENCAGE